MSVAARLEKAEPGYGVAADGPATARRARATTGHVLAVASLIVLLPNLLFASSLAPIAGSLMLAGVAGSIAATVWRRPAAGAVLAQAIDYPRLGLCLAGAFLLLLLGGEGHVFFSNYDWLFRDAVLSDLIGTPFPPGYAVAGQSLILRAPLGMYLGPALVGRAMGLAIGHAALLVQNGILLGALLYTLCGLAGRRAALVVVVFVSFSGLDVLGQVLMWVEKGNDLAAFALPSHIESWLPGEQYSSVVTQLFWVPNHALPSYWLTLLALLCARREVGVGQLGLAMAASLFWSPFAVIGILPIAAVLLVRQAGATATSLRFWIAAAAAACFLPVAVYLKSDAAQVPFGFAVTEPFAVILLAEFLLIEIPHLVVVGAVWGRLGADLRILLRVAIGLLLVLPSLRFGLHNDLVMRASIPSLMLLSIGFAEAMAIAARGRPFLLTVAVCLLLVGAVTPLLEIVRALAIPAFSISHCNVVTVWKKLEGEQPNLENYLARPSAMPAWLLDGSLAPPSVPHLDTVCWPDIPVDPLTKASAASIRAMLDARGRDGAPRF